MEVEAVLVDILVVVATVVMIVIVVELAFAVV